MKLQKFAKLAQRTGLCEAYGGPAGGMILSCGSAVFPAQELPAAASEEQLRAMLDIAPEKWDKIVCRMLPREDFLSGGVSLLADQDGDETLEPLGFFGQYESAAYDRVMRTKTGRMVFLDGSLLAPVLDEIRKSDYISYVLRRMRSGAAYVVVKNGFSEILAALMPVDVYMRDYCQRLAELESLCTAELARLEAEGTGVAPRG